MKIRVSLKLVFLLLVSMVLFYQGKCSKGNNDSNDNGCSNIDKRTPCGNIWYVYDEPEAVAVPALYMGETNGSSLTIDNYSSENPYRGGNCIKVKYDAIESWAGAFFPYSGDWRVFTHTGVNLSGYRTLGFYARSASGNYTLEKIAFGDRDGDTSFADLATNVVLTQNWQRFSFDVSGYDLSSINGLMHFYVTADKGAGTFYIDDVFYEK